LLFSFLSNFSSSSSINILIQTKEKI